MNVFHSTLGAFDGRYLCVGHYGRAVNAARKSMSYRPRLAMYKILVLAVLAAPAWAGWVEDYRSGEALLDQRRFATALERLQTAAKEAEAQGTSDAKLATVYDALGRAAMGSEQYRDGKRYFERALRLSAEGPLEAQATVTSN